MRILACLLLVAALAAVETKPVPVLRVIDGDTIEVAADLGGQRLPISVRLLYVDTPESRDNKHGDGMDEGRKAKASLEELTAGVFQSEVSLSGLGERLERDQNGSVLAQVSASLGAPGKMLHVDLSHQMIARGWSVYWRKYGDAPEPWHTHFLKAQEQARAENLGAWATAPQWMQDKANERTAPKKEAKP